MKEKKAASQRARACAHEGGGGDDLKKRADAVIATLRKSPDWLGSERKIRQAIADHPDRDAEGLAEKLSSGALGATTGRGGLAVRFAALLPDEPERPAPKPWPPSEVDSMTLQTTLNIAGMEDDLRVPGHVRSLAGGVLHVERGEVRWTVGRWPDRVEHARPATAEDFEPVVEVLRRDGYDVERVELHEDPEAEAKAAASAALDAKSRKTLLEMGYTEDELRKADL